MSRPTLTMSAPSHIQQRKISQQAPIDDPKQKQINALCFDYLLMELVPLSKRTELSQTINGQMEKMELVDHKGQEIGYELGKELAEYLLYIKNEGNLNILETLDIMKFVCRDVWRLLYLKQMDNLRTNHRVSFSLLKVD